MKKLHFILLITYLFITPQSAFAGDGATVILKSGTTVVLNNGFKQLASGMDKFTKKGGENYYIKLQLESSSFYINLGTVAILCRDECSSMKITQQKKR